jgi:hypothetical protein
MKEPQFSEAFKRSVRETADKLEHSAVFLCIFNEHMIEEIHPLIQMGLAVYMDKPIYLVMPEVRLKLVPENLRRLAKGIETYDDTMPRDLMKTAMEAAVTRLLASELRERLSK